MTTASTGETLMALLAQNCPWQRIVNSAYDRWRDHDRGVRQQLDRGEITQHQARQMMWSFADLLANCTTAEREALVLGKLNQQIENGGVQQWIDNGYAQDSVTILAELMPRIGATSGKIWQMLYEFLSDWEVDGDHEYSQHLNSVDLDASTDEADKFDDWFYGLSDAWHSEVYGYIAGLSVSR
jgi:hypothetical protein